MTTRALVLAFLCLGLLAGPARAEDDAASAAIVKATADLAAGRLPEAIATLEAALEKAPGEDRHRVEALLGDALVRAGEPYRALQYLQAAVDGLPSAAHHLRLAEALLAIARTNAAGSAPRWIEVVPYLEDALQQAKQAEGEKELGARRLAVVGEVRYRMGEPAAAAEAFEAIPEGGLAEGEALRVADLQARALYDLGRYEDSAVAFERAGNPRGTASALAAARKGPEAIAIYARLLADAPGDSVLLAEALAAARYTSSEAELAGVLAGLDAEGADRAKVLVTRGLLSEVSGATEAAERLFQAAVEADPEASRPRYELGRLRLVTADGREDRYDAAVEALIGALERAPTDPQLLAVLWDLAGRDYARAWRSSAAMTRTIRVQRALVEADPEDGLAWANLGNTLRIAGHQDEAVAAYDRAVAVEPQDAGIASDRGLALNALGRSEEALEAFEHAVRLDPDYDAAHQNAARLLWRAGRDEEAAAHLTAAEVRTRATGGNWMRYRFLQDRIYRSRRRPELR